MNYLILIPARGGSKGVLKKNIYPICNRPMIAYTIDLLHKVKWNGDVVISTDSQEIADISNQLIKTDDNYYVVRRPSELARDESSTEDVAFHTINYMKDAFGRNYDTLITMAPNLPLRTPKMFLDCIAQYEKMPARFDSQVCFCRSDEDLWIKKEDNEFVRMFPDAPRRRQDRMPFYIEKGSMTISKVKALISTGSLWGNRIYGYEMDELLGVDVHDINDIHYLGYIIENNLINGESKESTKGSRCII